MIIHVLAKVGSLFLMLLVGALARKRRIITDEALDSLTRVVLYVTLPFLFIYVLVSRCLGNTIALLWKMPLFAVMIIAAGYAIGSLMASLLKLEARRKETFIFLISFQNSGFLAIPIAFALFGEEAVLNVVVFNIGYNLLLWTFGIWLFGRSGGNFDIRSMSKLVNPGTVALAVGAALGAMCVKLPDFFMDTSRMIGNSTIPLAMIVVGAILMSGEFKRGARLAEMSAIVICKLAVIPLIFLGLTGLFSDITGMERSIIVLQACMPSAASSALFAKRFGGDYEFAASGVFFTTLFGVITVPLFMSIFG
jgi:hypothetical protein